MKQNIKQYPTLSIRDFARLKAIFDKKHWPTDSDFGDNKFENFCNFLMEYNLETRDLILNLTENFLWVKELDYLRLFAIAFDSFVSNWNFKGNNKIILCPLLPEADFGKNKSSTFLLYLIKAQVHFLQNKYHDYCISLIDTPERVPLDAIKKGTTLCLLDDFVGSGKTAEAAASYFLDRDILSEQIAIVSLVAMETGITDLKESGFTTYTAYIEKKGITGSGRDEDKEIQLMHALEEQLGVDEKYCFGYEKSEALVSMVRTPNNTFPVYWYRKEKKKINLYAPFPR